MRYYPQLFKLVATLFVTILFTTSAAAQISFSYRDSLGTYKVRFYPHVESDDAATRYRIPLVKNTTELRLGTAYTAFTPLGYTNDTSWDYNFSSGKLNENVSYTNPCWCTIGFEAGSWIKEWLYVGGAAVYTGGFRSIRESPMNKRVGTFNLSSYSLMPIVRFAWVRRDIVQLYSGLGLGVALAHYHNNGYTSWAANLAHDITLIGISVGRKFFGYCDLGFGTRGIVSAGIGWRFNKK